MKLLKALKNISTKICHPCSTVLSFLDGTNHSHPQPPANAIATPLDYPSAVEHRNNTPNTILTTTTGWDTFSPVSRMPSQRSNATSTLLLGAANAAISNRAEYLNQESSASTTRPPSSGLLPIREHSNSGHDVYNDHIRILQSEIETMSLVHYRQQDEIQQQQREIEQLGFNLERERKVTKVLQDCKSIAPRKLKKELATLKSELQNKEHEVKDLKRKYAQLLRAAQVGDGVAHVKDLMDKAVSELEANAAQWIQRMEDVGRKARQIERKTRGLGMWWTADEFDDIMERIGVALP